MKADLSSACRSDLSLAPRRTQLLHRRLLGVRRDKPACCRGRKSPTGKENSESILTSSLAGDIVRCRLKRRQRYWWAGLLNFEKPMEQDADSVPMGGRQHSNHASREWIARSCVV